MSPAVLTLLGAGIKPAILARELGVSRQAVSYQLTGQTAETSPRLLNRIAELGGRQLAETVAAQVDAEREKRT